MAFVTGFTILCWLLTIDRLCQDSGTGCLTHTSWTTEQKCVCQLLLFDRIPQCSSDMRLPHNCIKSLRPVFASRNDEFIHNARDAKLVKKSHAIVYYSIDRVTG